MTATRYVWRLQSLLRRSFSIMSTPPAAEMAESSSSVVNSISTATTPERAISSLSASVPHVPVPRRGVSYRGKVVLAPMVRSGELPSRLLALHYGADLVWGPETVDRSMIGTAQRTNPRTGCIEWTRKQNNGTKAGEINPNECDDSIIYRIDPKRESEKLIYQIGTASPALAVQSASLVAPYVAGIDVNAGCPKPFSTSGGMGAALLRTPDLLASILTALVEEVGIPNEIGISVKIRLLETPEMTSELVNKLCKTGIHGLTIHCRTTPMRPRERAIREQLRMIRDICHAHGVSCTMNGDVYNRDQALELMKEFGVDGAMIATAAEANSSVFRSKADGGVAHWREVVREYLRYAVSVENRWGNTKFLLGQLMPGKDPVTQEVMRCRSYSQILEKLEHTDDADLVEMAKNVDHQLKLDVPKVTKSDIKRMNKQIQKENREKKLEKKRKAEENREPVVPKKGRTRSRSRSQSPVPAPTAIIKTPIEKATIAADNAGFDGVGEGSLAVAA